MSAQSQALPVFPSTVVKPELKVCKLGKYHAAKLHLATGGRTLCGREALTYLRKTKFTFERNCCKFCCELAIPQKLVEVKGSGHPAIAGSRLPIFHWLRKAHAYPHRDRGWD